MAEVTEQAPRVDWRRLRGGDPLIPATKPRPPGTEIRRSTSEGDMRRGSFRESRYEDHFTQAVANDDGTPITGEVENLLAQVLVELKLFNKYMRMLIEE